MGDDRLIAGAGTDSLVGGPGADRFLFESLSDSSPLASLRDVIRDFSRTDGDKIDLSGIDANATWPAIKPSHWSGVTPFYGVAGQLHFANGGVEGDVNGDRVADFSIQVTDLALPINSDFIL